RAQALGDHARRARGDLHGRGPRPRGGTGGDRPGRRLPPGGPRSHGRPARRRGALDDPQRSRRRRDPDPPGRRRGRDALPGRCERHPPDPAGGRVGAGGTGADHIGQGRRPPPHRGRAEWIALARLARLRQPSAHRLGDARPRPRGGLHLRAAAHRPGADEPMSGENAPVVGYAPMLEQVAPREAVRLIRRADEAGLHGVMLADVFQPWTPAQGEAGALWPVLAAAAEHTSGPLGAVFTPGYRWHPALIAQHAATMASMFGNRHWLGLSSGEALNDAITGEYWPRPPERIGRLFESAELIGKLFTNSAAGKDTSHDGEHLRLEPTRLWSMPERRPPLLVAAAGPVTARRAGRSSDGFITLGGPAERLLGLLERFRLGAREAGRD